MPHTTIEKTSKPLKAQKALATIIMIIGAVVTGANVVSASSVDGTCSPVGLCILVVGLIWRATATVLIWWHHG